MSEQPTSPAWTDADDHALTLLLIRSAYGLALEAENAERRESRQRHPAGRAMPTEPLIPEDMWDKATYVPLIAPPLPNYSRFGRAITLYAALVLTVTGFLIGITVHRWAVLLVIGGVLLAGRVAIVHYRKADQS